MLYDSTHNDVAQPRIKRRGAGAFFAAAICIAAGGCFELEGTGVAENDSLPEVNVEDAQVVEAPRTSADNSAGVVTADQVFADPTFASEEVTIRGAVLGKRHVKLDDDHTGIVVELQPGGDFIDVLIGTTRFNEEHDVNVGIADRIMVTGTVVDTERGRRMLLARELVWRDRTIELRDEDGRPKWED